MDKLKTMFKGKERTVITGAAIAVATIIAGVTLTIYKKKNRK